MQCGLCCSGSTLYIIRMFCCTISSFNSNQTRTAFLLEACQPEAGRDEGCVHKEGSCSGGEAEDVEATIKLKA